MKTKLVILLIAVLPLFFIGCEKSEAPEDTQTKEITTANLKIEADLCGEAMPIVFKNYGGYETGSGEIGNDEEKLYLRIEAPSDGFYIRHYLGYIGSAEDFFITLGNTIDPNDPGSAHMEPGTWNIPKVEPAGNLEFVELEFLLADYPQPEPGECFIVAFVGNFTSDGYDTKWGWMVYEGSYKSDGYYMDYCVQECPPNEPPPSIGSETCFAYNAQYSYCFSEFDKKKGKYKPNGPSNKNFSRWGWTNGIAPIENQTGGQGLEEGNYTFEIWAGAGQCDLSKGTEVGSLSIDYDAGTATVTYNMFDGYVLGETHLYIGDNPIPAGKNGKATVAPGQYPYSDGDATTVEDDLVVYEISNLSGDIWVVAHGVAEDAE